MVFTEFLSDLKKKFRNSTNVYSAIVSFVKVGEMKAVLYLAEQINFSRHSTHLSCDLREVVCKRLMLLQTCEFRENSLREGSTVRSVKEITFTRVP